MFSRYPPCLVRVACASTAMWCLLASAPIAQQTAILASDIVARAVKAMGGESAFKAVQSMHARGTVSIPSQNISGDVEVFSARPNKTLMRATMTGIGNPDGKPATIEEGFDGKVGWSMDPINGPALVTGRALAEKMIDSWFDAPLHATDHVRQMTVMGQEPFDKRTAYKVKMVFTNGVEQVEYFDVETGLQIGQEASRDTPVGIVPTRSMARDFKKFGNLMMATTMEETFLGVSQIVTITSYEFDKVPATTFDLPKAIKALIK